MFFSLALRLASRRAPLTLSAIKPLKTFQLRPVLNTVTRSFFASSLRALPSNTRSSKTKTTTRKTTSSKAKATSGRSKTKAKAKPKPKSRVVAKKRPAPKKKSVAKKPAKPKQVVVPRGIKIPSAGPSVYTYWVTKYYLANHPKPTRENIAEHSAKASQAWKEIPPNEKEKITAEVKGARMEADRRRGEYLRSISPSIMREINRRRVAKGKLRIRVPRDPATKKKLPLSPFIIYTLEYRQKHKGDGRKSIEMSKDAGAEWRAMSDKAKEPYLQESAKRAAA